MKKELQHPIEESVLEVQWTYDDSTGTWHASTSLGKEGPQYCLRLGESPEFHAMSGGFGKLRGYMYSDGTGKQLHDKESLNKFKYGLIQVSEEERINPDLIAGKHSFHSNLSDLGRAGGANWKESYQEPLDDQFLDKFERDLSTLHRMMLPITRRNMEVMIDGLELVLESFPQGDIDIVPRLESK